MSYERVIPRDLFNEAKLLKCLGQLSLIIHSNVGIEKWRLSIEHDTSNHDGFNIVNDGGSGDIECNNVHVYVAGEEIQLTTGLNSRRAYPLIFESEENSIGDIHEGFVFDDHGDFTGEFVAYLESKM